MGLPGTRFVMIRERAAKGLITLAALSVSLQIRIAEPEEQRSYLKSSLVLSFKKEQSLTVSEEKTEGLLAGCKPRRLLDTDPLRALHRPPESVPIA